jgi:hypothetical protein
VSGAASWENRSTCNFAGVMGGFHCAKIVVGTAAFDKTRGTVFGILWTPI